MIEARDLTVTYDGRAVLREVDLTVPDGAAAIRHGEVTRLDHAPPPFPRGVSARSTSRSSPTLSRMTASVHAKRSVVCRYSFDS